MVLIYARQITQYAWDIEWNVVILNNIQKKQNRTNEPLFP